MTLLELLAGLVVTGLMASAGYGAFAGLLDARGRARAAAREVERAAALRETLDGWLTGGAVLVERGPRPDVPSRTGGGADRGDVLTVVTTAPTPAGTPTTFLRLFVDDDPGTPARGLALEYRRRPADSLEVRELDARVGAMRVDFLDRRTGRWVPAAEAAAARLAAVRLTLVGAPGDPLPAVLGLPFVRAIGDDAALAGPPPGGAP